MEEQLHYPLAVTHLLQQTLRSFCSSDSSQWAYAVFWRILPRNFPPPKWDLDGSLYDRSRGNRRNWILVWEDGFCNFAASCAVQDVRGLQPELFFKMSHEIYNYGEGLIGNVASDYSHKWVFKDSGDQENNFLSTWHNQADSHPRTWKAQFQSGVKTIALIAVREGVVQLGAMNQVGEDLNLVVSLRKKFTYLESIPGVLLPHPSSSALPARSDGDVGRSNNIIILPPGVHPGWACHAAHPPQPATLDKVYANHDLSQQLRITPSMSSLEVLLSKLPSVLPPETAPSASSSGLQVYASSVNHPRPSFVGAVAEEEMLVEDHQGYDHHQKQQQDEHRVMGSMGGMY